MKIFTLILVSVFLVCSVGFADKNAWYDKEEFKNLKRELKELKNSRLSIDDNLNRLKILKKDVSKAEKSKKRVIARMKSRMIKLLERRIFKVRKKQIDNLIKNKQYVEAKQSLNKYLKDKIVTSYKDKWRFKLKVIDILEGKGKKVFSKIDKLSLDPVTKSFLENNLLKEKKQEIEKLYRERKYIFSNGYQAKLHKTRKREVEVEKIVMDKLRNILKKGNIDSIDEEFKELEKTIPDLYNSKVIERHKIWHFAYKHILKGEVKKALKILKKLSHKHYSYPYLKTNKKTEFKAFLMALDQLLMMSNIKYNIKFTEKDRISMITRIIDLIKDEEIKRLVNKRLENLKSRYKGNSGKRKDFNDIRILIKKWFDLSDNDDNKGIIKLYQPQVKLYWFDKHPKFRERNIFNRDGEVDIRISKYNKQKSKVTTRWKLKTKARRWCDFEVIKINGKWYLKGDK